MISYAGTLNVQTICSEIEEAPGDKRATETMLNVLKGFYQHLLSHGLESPLESGDKYINPNPVMFFKVYGKEEILLVHFLINEGFLRAKITERQPLIIEANITQKGVEFLLMENLFKI